VAPATVASKANTKRSIQMFTGYRIPACNYLGPRVSMGRRLSHLTRLENQSASKVRPQPLSYSSAGTGTSPTRFAMKMSGFPKPLASGSTPTTA